MSAWLAFTGVCFWAKEALNFWLGFRYEKAQKDTLDDAQAMGDGNPQSIHQEPPKATRKEPVKKKRNAASSKTTAPEDRFAKILRLRPPYTLAKAEENYRALIRLEHPDGHENSPESNAATADLNEAVEFFRGELSG